ncbi:MAG: FtsQ-type POTRA domain-containing protein [Roseburia sp.]|nr:FtsQ-type POTRA domain-containing protein [Roseburia sp.]MCM1278505.1 FtsQ-type POTRA domain-containing protein [Robinsoniella sp.]
MKKVNVQFIMKNRIRIMFVLTCIILLCSGFIFLTSYYKVTEVEVTGNEHYSKEEIQEMIVKGGLSENSLFLALKYHNREISDVPFIESMSVEVVSSHSIKITVYEKALAGCVEYLGKYMYFDREGIVVESAAETTPGIPQITGMSYGYIILYEKLPVEDDDIFKEILSMTQLLEKYEIDADKIHFDKAGNMTLYFGEAKAALGTKDNIDQKVMQLSHILPELEGKSGVLHMEDYEEGTKRVSFKPE